MVNFDAIHDVKPQKVKVFAPLPGNSPAPRMDAPAKRQSLCSGAGEGRSELLMRYSPTSVRRLLSNRFVDTVLSS